MERTCLRTGVLHMGSHSNKKCLLKPWDTHLAFSLSNKGPQSFLLTPTRGFSVLFHFYSFYKVPVPDCWSSLLFLPLINWVILGKVFLVSETSPLVWKGAIDIRTVINIIVLILVIIGCQMVGSKCINCEAVLGRVLQDRRLKRQFMKWAFVCANTVFSSMVSDSDFWLPLQVSRGFRLTSQFTSCRRPQLSTKYNINLRDKLDRIILKMS